MISQVKTIKIIITNDHILQIIRIECYRIGELPRIIRIE